MRSCQKSVSVVVGLMVFDRNSSSWSLCWVMNSATTSPFLSTRSVGSFFTASTSIFSTSSSISYSLMGMAYFDACIRTFGLTTLQGAHQEAPIYSSSYVADICGLVWSVMGAHFFHWVY